MTRRKVDLTNKRSKAMEAALENKNQFEQIEFMLDGKAFKTVETISHKVSMNVARIGNEDYSDAQQSEAIFVALLNLVDKSDRKNFEKYIDEIEMTTADMISLLSLLMEEITNLSGQSSTQDGNSTSETSTPRMGTL